MPRASARATCRRAIPIPTPMIRRSRRKRRTSVTVDLLHPDLDDPRLSAGWADLRERGLLAADGCPTRAAELAAVRSVAGSDLALGRIFDGHRNGLERLLRHRSSDVD